MTTFGLNEICNLELAWKNEKYKADIIWSTPIEPAKQSIKIWALKLRPTQIRRAIKGHKIKQLYYKIKPYYTWNKPFKPMKNWNLTNWSS